MLDLQLLSCGLGTFLGLDLRLFAVVNLREFRSKADAARDESGSKRPSATSATSASLLTHLGSGKGCPKKHGTERGASRVRWRKRRSKAPLPLAGFVSAKTLGLGLLFSVSSVWCVVCGPRSGSQGAASGCCLCSDLSCATWLSDLLGGSRLAMSESRRRSTATWLPFQRPCCGTARCPPARAAWLHGWCAFVIVHRLQAYGRWVPCFLSTGKELAYLAADYRKRRPRFLLRGLFNCFVLQQWDRFGRPLVCHLSGAAWDGGAAPWLPWPIRRYIVMRSYTVFGMPPSRCSEALAGLSSFSGAHHTSEISALKLREPSDFLGHFSVLGRLLDRFCHLLWRLSRSVLASRASCQWEAARGICCASVLPPCLSCLSAWEPCAVCS